MKKLRQLGTEKIVLGLIHLLPMPGTPHYEPGNLEKARDKALQDAWSLHEGGADGGLIQTIDRAYPVGDDVDPARLAGMATVVDAVRRKLPASFEIGVQILWNATKASLGVAFACGASFVRCTSFVGTSRSPYGSTISDPVGLLNYRKLLGADDVSFIAEIHSMHFRPLEYQSLGRLAYSAGNAGASAVEIAEPDETKCMGIVEEIRREAPGVPILLGGHTRHSNAARLMAPVDGAFVGTTFQPDGWGTSIHSDQVRSYVEIVRGL